MRRLDPSLPSLRLGPVLPVVMALVLGACGGSSGGDDGTTPDPDAEVEVEVDTTDPDGDGEDGSEAGPDTPDTDGDGDVDDGTDAETAETSTGFPADGLLIRIIEPGAHGVAVATGPTLVLNGVLFGDATAILWQAGAQSGTATPGRFWQAGPIALEPGDNLITVTASDGVRSVGDKVVVTYNPAFRFDEPLAVTPSTLWVGEPSDVVFTVALARTGQVDLSRLEVVRVNEAGEELEVLGVLADDGRLESSGDEIEQDGVFTRTARLSCDGETTFYRARVPVTAGESYSAISPIVRVDCLERLSRASCEQKQALIASAEAALAGGAEPGVVVGQLTADPLVAEAGQGGDGGLWMVFTDGVLGAVLLPREGLRGGPASTPVLRQALGAAALAATPLPVQSKRALILSPFSASLTADESPAIAERLAETGCPAFEVEAGRALVGAEADLGRLRSLSGYGVATLATHGAELFATMSPARMRSLRWAHIGPQEVLWSGSPVACDALIEAQTSCVVTPQTPTGGCPTGTRCLVTRGVASDTGSSGQGVCVDETQEDLRQGRVVMSNLGYAVVPAFFSAWRGRGYPSSLIHLGACGSMKNGSLASAFYAAGARVVSGFSGTVSDGFAESTALALMESRLGGTVAEVVGEELDPEHGGAWRVFGATNLTLADREVINGGFERELVGWRTSGDGRVVSRFGDAQPVSGKSMGLLSTGLGFSLASGELRQSFCIPEGASRLSFDWKFTSEEFKEWCGTPKFQDRFTATLLYGEGAASESQTLFSVSVDDLCGYADGTCSACPSPRPCDAACDGEAGCYEQAGVCAGAFNCQCGRDFTGLSPSTIGFDQGGVYEVMWRKVERDIGRFAGRGAVTLVFSVEDLGDSLFDTAVLVDEVTVR